MSKLQLRRAWFQLHKWIGLVLAALIIPLSLSGALLVWDQPLDRFINPARYAVSGDAVLPPRAYVAAAQHVLAANEHIASLSYPDGRGPVVVQANIVSTIHRAGPPARVSVWLDPPAARVLAVADSRSSVLRVIHRLHGSLMVPGVGRQLVGWIGVAMMLSCLTGLWLWWPIVGKWTRRLRWQRHKNFDANLHHLVGFWIALPLFILSLTGAWIALPALFAGRDEARPPARIGDQPIAAPRTSPDTVLVEARRVGKVGTIFWPSVGADPTWIVVAGKRTVTLSDRNATMHVVPTRPHGGAGITGTMRRIHEGDGMGLAWQTIIFIAGIMPAALAVTGIVMWWRARSWRAEARKRRSGSNAMTWRRTLAQILLNSLTSSPGKRSSSGRGPIE